MKIVVKEGKSFCCHRKDFGPGDVISSDFWSKDGEKECKYLVDGGWAEYVKAPEAQKVDEVIETTEETPEAPEAPKKRGRKKKGEK